VFSCQTNAFRGGGAPFIRSMVKLAMRCNRKDALGIYFDLVEPLGRKRGTGPMACNVIGHESSAAAPAYIFRGRDLNYPLGLEWKASDWEMGKDAGSIQEFWGKALRKFRSARRQVADRYNAGRRRAEFQGGDRVMVRCYPQSSKLHQRSAKLDYLKSYYPSE
jgi:hypothetical protein